MTRRDCQWTVSREFGEERWKEASHRDGGIGCTVVAASQISKEPHSVVDPAGCADESLEALDGCDAAAAPRVRHAHPGSSPETDHGPRRMGNPRSLKTGRLCECFIAAFWVRAVFRRTGTGTPVNSSSNSEASRS